MHPADTVATAQPATEKNHRSPGRAATADVQQVPVDGGLLRAGQAGVPFTMTWPGLDALDMGAGRAFLDLEA
jgi:hypothetical protein